MMRNLLHLFLPLLIISCANNKAEIDELFQTIDTNIELATNVKVIYSDSARVRLQVTGPVLERHVGKGDPKDVFTDGVHVEFMDDRQVTLSWLDARFLERRQNESLVFVRDSVVLYNADNEKLETSELIWDEENEYIYTDKFVRITQPEKGDTSYGYGFETNRDFTEFRIKKNFSAKMNIEDVSAALGQ